MTVTWQYELTPQAIRDLRKLDTTVRSRIIDAFDRFMAAPFQGDVKKLQGTNEEWRLRVGSWRVRFRRDDERKIVVVTRDVHRSSAYRT